jgi:hypothetical protein
MAEKDLSPEEAIDILNRMVSEQDKAAASTGACVYIAGGKTYCASLTKDQCNQLKGIWNEGKPCP